MTEQEILQQIDELRAKLESLRAGNIENSDYDSELSEAEKEKQHQEDLVLNARYKKRMNPLMTVSILYT